MRNRPCVFIVGAGPGDPGLISVRGQRLLEAADVVVYDHQVHWRLLRVARADAEKIDVGAAAPRAQDQDAISLLLVEKAREGKSVVRLKWGDPFVFDSGGKEALFLHEQQIPFEVIPGIPAPIGIPAYAGIPITYPGAGDTLTLVRGHEAETDEAPNVDWERLAGLEGTLVCYAGARQIGAIVNALLSKGRSPEESAALIYAGTTPAQETVAGTLATIVERAHTGDAAMLVIGQVAGLREHLRWFDDRPLFGKRIVVTRSREQAGELVDLLEERGAEAIQAPTIRIAPPEDADALDRACAEAGAYDWIVFTSVNAVESFMLAAIAPPLSNPGSTDITFTKLRINSPAPTSSTSATATSAATSPFLVRDRTGAAALRPPSASASRRSARDACNDGSRPNRSGVTTASTTANSSTRASIPMSIPRGRFAVSTAS